MFARLSKNRAQTTLEYAILIGVIVAGLIAMQVYLKRGFQGKMKESADSMGQQFSPGYTEAHYKTNSFTNSTETVDQQQITTTDILRQETNRVGNEQIDKFTNEFWWN